VIIGLVANKTIGFAVDSVNDVLDIPHAEIQEPPELVASGERPVVRGIAHVDGRLVALLDLLAVVGGDLNPPA
jgi:purine-binding chemotaxis protein CheW